MPISLGFWEWGCPHHCDSALDFTSSEHWPPFNFSWSTCSLAIKLNILRVVTFRLKWGRNGQGYVILLPFNSLTHSPMNRLCGSTSLIPVITPSVLTVLDNFGPSQTSNFSRDEPNSNLGRPKLI